MRHVARRPEVGGQWARHEAKLEELERRVAALELRLRLKRRDALLQIHDARPHDSGRVRLQG